MTCGGAEVCVGPSRGAFDSHAKRRRGGVSTPAQDGGLRRRANKVVLAEEGGKE